MHIKAMLFILIGLNLLLVSKSTVLRVFIFHKSLKPDNFLEIKLFFGKEF